MFIPFPIYVIGREIFYCSLPGSLAKIYQNDLRHVILFCMSRNYSKSMPGRLADRAVRTVTFSVYHAGNTGYSAELMQIVYYEQLSDAKLFYQANFVDLSQKSLYNKEDSRGGIE